jgi:hypothetical protein
LARRIAGSVAGVAVGGAVVGMTVGAGVGVALGGSEVACSSWPAQLLMTSVSKVIEIKVSKILMFITSISLFI